MTKKKNSMKQVLSCVILLLIAAAVFIAVSFGAGRRAGMRGEETLPPLDTFSVSDNTSAPDESSDAPQSTEAIHTEPRESKPVSLTVDEIVFVMPVDGGVLTGASLTVPVYSMTMNDHRTHTGVDIAAAAGSPVVSCADGVVTGVFEDPMMGVTVEIEHGGDVTSVYQNLSLELAPEITVGSTVSAGDVIGAVGNTALIECEEEDHLHFELKVNGELVDPAEYITMTSVSDSFEG